MIKQLVVSVMLLSASSAYAQSRYLYVWAGANDHEHPAFLAVLDANPASAHYGQTVDSVETDWVHAMPQHIELTMPSRGALFASGFMAGRIALFDFKQPDKPRLAGSVDVVPHYSRPHSFLRKADGHVLATLQFGDSTLPGNPGGVAEFSETGKLLRTTSAADANFPGARLRVYALEQFPRLHRFVTTSSPMDEERTADVIQVWDIDRLKLLRTVKLAERADTTERYPFEIRAVGNGDVALMNTYNCGLFYVSGIATDKPTVEHVMNISDKIGCGVPLVIDKYWIMPIAYAHALAVLDISDPKQPREVSRLDMPDNYRPHWITKDPLSDRVVISEQGDGSHGLFVAHFSTTTGRLTLDQSFKPNFGIAVPHGAIFVN